MERHRRVFRLDRFFDYFYCCEEYDFIPKYQIFRLIALQHTGQFIVVGDRFHDIETATENGLASIGCGYGYGSMKELSAADIIVSGIYDIPDAVNTLLNERK
jgi:phosphoglycolate phosphatase